MSADDRPARLSRAAAERGVDLLLVAEGANLRWLTGFTGSNGLAVLDVRGGGGGLLITDFRYMTQVAEQVSPAWEIRQAAQELLGPGLAEHLPGADGGRSLRVGFDDRVVTVEQHTRMAQALEGRAELIAAGGLIEELRQIKDDGEAVRMRSAAQLADDALAEVLGRGVAGRTEADVAIDLEVAMRRRGAQELAFPSIVAGGAHGALPHAEPRPVAIEPGTLLTIDWGARLDGYCSDCTRTFAVGEVSGALREIYDLVLEAQVAALAAVRPGPLGREIDAVARDIITEAGRGEAFGHGLGHGVGLEVHEGPRLSRLGDTPLAPGMAVTVEPGVYVAGLGGVRIEDLVLVTEGGHEVLTGLPKALQSLA